MQILHLGKTSMTSKRKSGILTPKPGMHKIQAESLFLNKYNNLKTQSWNLKPV